jgi:hypothetical protein
MYRIATRGAAFGPTAHAHGINSVYWPVVVMAIAAAARGGGMGAIEASDSR